MRNIYKIVLAIFILFFAFALACGPEDKSVKDVIGGNNPPFTPSNPGPSDGQQGVSSFTSLKWDGGDKDEDTVNYEIFLGTDKSSLPSIANSLTSNFYQPPAKLEENTTYYWQIIARDNSSSTPGPIWSFNTNINTAGNNPPWIDPHSAKPADGSTNVPTRVFLSWVGGDFDGDMVDYDIYLGTDPNQDKLPNIGTSFSNNTSYAYPETLAPNTTYYWYVLAKDGANNRTKGSLWKFTTGTEGGGNGAPWVIDPKPFDGAIGQPTMINLSWVGKDQEGDPLDFEIYLGTDSIKANLPMIGQTFYNNTFFPYPTPLNKNTTYFWYVIADDKKGGRTEGPLWRFATGDGTGAGQIWVNNPNPFDGAVNQPLVVNLNWAGGDPKGEPLDYEIYLGTDRDPDKLPMIGSTYNNYTSWTHPQPPNSLTPNTIYYWFVKAKSKNSGDMRGPIWSFTTGSFSNNPPSVSNPTPPDNSTNQPLFISLNWMGSDPEGDSINCEIHLGTDSNPNNIPFVGNTYNNYFTYQHPAGLDKNKTYYWFVIATDSKGNITKGPVWKFTTGSFTNNPPNISNPNPWDGANEQPLYITLSWMGWDYEGDPIDYEIHLGSDPTNIPIVGNTYYNYSSFQYGSLLNKSTTYYWYIVAKDNFGNVAKGPVWKFTTGSYTNNPPNISDPSPWDGANEQPLYITLSWFGWDWEGDPIDYEIYLGSDPNNIPIAGNTYYNYSSFQYPAQLAKSTTYYWYVKAKDSKGNVTKGPVWKFITGSFDNSPPSVSNPSPWDGAWEQPLYIYLNWSGWDPEYENIDYEIYLGTDTNSNNLPLVGYTYYNYTTFYYPYKLVASTTYYWYVKAKDSSGNVTRGPVWSFKTGSFTNNPPWISSPYPFDGDTGQSLYVYLSWSGGDYEGDYIYYDLYFGTSPNVYNLPWVARTESYGYGWYSYPYTLTANTTYYWYVSAMDANGNITTGPLWRFTTGGGTTNNPPEVTNPTPTSSYTNIIRSSSTNLSWTGSDYEGESITYKLYVYHMSNTGQEIADVDSYLGSTNSYPLTGLVPYTSYYWRVTATDSSGNVTEGPLWVFVTGSF